MPLVEILFNNGIDENLRKFQNLNSHLGLKIVPVMLKNTTISYNEVSNIDSEVKIALNQNIPLKHFDDVGIGSFSGNIDLSLIGACPLVDRFERTIPSDLDVESLAGIITPNMQYQYEIGASYTYKASYNVASLASKIKKMSSKGGLFKSSSMATLIDTAESSGWFSLKITCDDSRVCDRAKEDTALQIKNRLIAEVLNQITLTKMGYSMTPTNASKPGDNGASGASDALKKCDNEYCQAGSIILDVAGSSFGRTSKIDEFITKNNHVAIEEVKVNTPVVFSGVMGFGK